MADPAYAIVKIRCDPAKLKAVEGIPNLRIEVRPEYTDDPAVILVHAFADAGAQAAARAMGCTVTVMKTAEEYKAQLEAAYRSIGEDDGRAGRNT